jgi:hypothetical protein
MGNVPSLFKKIMLSKIERIFQQDTVNHAGKHHG